VGLESVTFLGGDLKIGTGTFETCKKLKTVNAPSLEAWLSMSFENRGSSPLENGACLYLNGELLTHVEFPEGTKKIDDFQFSGYKYLESVTLPEGLEEIGYGAFENCSKISEITLPGSLTYIDSSAFAKCTSLKTLRVPSIHFLLELKNNGHLFNNVEALYVDGKLTTEVKIPEDVKVTNQYAFANWGFLTDLYIHSSFERIGLYGLYRCASLETVHFDGTMEQWETIVSHSPYWKETTDHYTVSCTDGEIVY
jgi:hypothetical protein